MGLHHKDILHTFPALQYPRTAERQSPLHTPQLWLNSPHLKIVYHNNMFQTSVPIQNRLDSLDVFPVAAHMCDHKMVYYAIRQSGCV